MNALELDHYDPLVMYSEEEWDALPESKAEAQDDEPKF